MTANRPIVFRRVATLRHPIFLPRSRPERARLALGLLALVVTSRARAEPPPAASATPPADASTDPVAPRLISSSDVPYPEGAQGDAVVRLVLTVDRHGSVEAALALDRHQPSRSVAGRA